MLKVSAFTLTTNSIKNQFPFIESIKSWLPAVDELVVIDGGSTDGTVEAIKAIGDGKIRIVQDDDTRWEDEWAYSRMGHNFNRGLEECTGDWVIKFDADYLINENGANNFKGECEVASRLGKLTLGFTRANFIVSNGYYVKGKKTLAINKTLAKKTYNLRYGFDLGRWGWGYDFIDCEFEENGIYFGNIIRYDSNCFIPNCLVFNYDYMFMTEEIAKEARRRHFFAENKQRNMEYRIANIERYLSDEELRRSPNISWERYNEQCVGNLGSREKISLRIEEHPELVRDRIMKLDQKHQGYDCWGWAQKSSYYN